MIYSSAQIIRAVGTCDPMWVMVTAGLITMAVLALSHATTRMANPGLFSWIAFCVSDQRTLTLTFF